MAEDAKKQPAPEAPGPAEGKPAAADKKGRMLTLGVFGGVMVVEAVAIFMCMKLMGSEPDPTLGMEHVMEATTKPWEETHELAVAEIRVPNNNGSRTILYSVKVVISVHHENQEKMKEFIENRKNTVDDVISRVIRSAEERHLAEPGLETLKRQIRFELGRLIGDDKIIEHVLIPECMPIPTGF